MKTKLLFAVTAAVVTLIGAGNQAKAEYCREYTETFRVGGRLQTGYGTACMQPDGQWQIVNSASPMTYAGQIVAIDDAPVYSNYYQPTQVVYARPRRCFYDRPRTSTSFSISFGNGGFYNYRSGYHNNWHDHGWHGPRGHGRYWD